MNYFKVKYQIVSDKTKTVIYEFLNQEEVGSLERCSVDGKAVFSILSKEELEHEPTEEEKMFVGICS